VIDRREGIDPIVLYFAICTTRSMYRVCSQRRRGSFAAVAGCDPGAKRPDIYEPAISSWGLPELRRCPSSTPHPSSSLWEDDLVVHIGRVLAAFCGAQTGSRHLGR